MFFTKSIAIIISRIRVWIGIGVRVGIGIRVGVRVGVRVRFVRTRAVLVNAISRDVDLINLSVGGPDFRDAPFVEKALDYFISVTE